MLHGIVDVPVRTAGSIMFIDHMAAEFTESISNLTSCVRPARRHADVSGPIRQVPADSHAAMQGILNDMREPGHRLPQRSLRMLLYEGIHLRDMFSRSVRVQKL